MKKTIIAAAALVAMVSCNKSLIENQTTEAGYGYISLGVTADTEMVVTKANVTDLSSYRVRLADSENNSVWTSEDGATDGYISYKSVTENSELWRVKAGTGYVVYVENKSEEDCYENNGEVYISGQSGPITVTAGTSTSEKVACSPKNSKVTAAYGDNFATSFNVEGLSITLQESEYRQVSLTVANASHDNADEAFFHAGKTVSWSMSVKPSNVTTSNTYTGSFETEAGKWTKVTFNSSDTENGKIVVTITADDAFGEGKSYTYTLDPLSNAVTGGADNSQN